MERQHQTKRLKYPNWISLSPSATSLLIHSLPTHLTKTVDKILSLVSILFTNLDSPSNITKIFYNGWIRRYLSRILMSSLSIICALILTTNYSKIKKMICFKKYPRVAWMLDTKYAGQYQLIWCQPKTFEHKPIPQLTESPG